MSDTGTEEQTHTFECFDSSKEIYLTDDHNVHVE